jgi:hypothetical protein
MFGDITYSVTVRYDTRNQTSTLPSCMFLLNNDRMMELGMETLEERQLSVSG